MQFFMTGNVKKTEHETVLDTNVENSSIKFKSRASEYIQSQVAKQQINELLKQASKQQISRQETFCAE